MTSQFFSFFLSFSFLLSFLSLFLFFLLLILKKKTKNKNIGEIDSYLNIMEKEQNNQQMSANVSIIMKAVMQLQNMFGKTLLYGMDRQYAIGLFFSFRFSFLFVFSFSFSFFFSLLLFLFVFLFCFLFHQSMCLPS